MRITTTTTRTRLAAVITAAVIAVTGSIAIAAPAGAATTAPARASTVVSTSVPAGTKLLPGDVMTSSNGQFRLVMQGDGNLVEYGIGNAVLWASNTAKYPGAVAVVGTDGVFSIRSGSKTVAKWGTSGHVGYDFGVLPDGSLRMRDSVKRTIWQLQNFQDRVTAGNVIKPGTVLRSDASSARKFTMQADGNLVQYLNGKAAWASRTNGHPGSWASVQTDGSLVVYGPDNRALWSSKTTTAGRGQLLVQVDSNVVLYGSKDTRVWSTRPVSGLLWPVASTRITGKFGDDRGAGHTPRYHQGADAGVVTGTAVYGSGSGTVTETVANNATFGNYVVVKYGLTTVLTAHLSKIEVKKGQVVSSKTEIAKSGNTGQSTGPHVHVETRVNGTLKDPLTQLHFR
ncbi:peptidoglycan DD-metalloendopeptidase family protein [Curtobacterium sp. PhB136]|uniref:peptidoglycan DD-metalloendopeptidase family protein n=1 Tax=Curtobacterium sp. PhB136 TaxID=2485181 RepID=UPI00104752F6|nr:peptidoglycan DD-metalloendopeptidase family protein [Curtobacterium sp. PhB136]TCK65588.1 D-mannose binding lectin [Curtobacterium sp. PhB136]